MAAKSSPPAKPKPKTQAETQAKSQTEKQTHKKKSGGGWRVQLMLVAILALAAAFMSYAVLIAIALLPTIVSFTLIDRSRSKNLTLIVGFLNFSGSFPFFLELAKAGGDMANALGIALNPANLVVMYTAAAAGYMIDWAMTGLVSNVMVARARGRLKDITERKKELVRRWGPDVMGSLRPADDDKNTK